ncbi:Na/Pi symporter [Halomonas denitrificans]|nr:Na/Pi symporter [Halomonas denitrificans]
MAHNPLAAALEAMGGLGLFLLGMLVMTEALKRLGGAAMRRALMHYTRTPASGALAGCLSTALLQSSSATTVAAVGFVGAGLLSFPHALGIVFGANLGTTVTGWLVALVGFRFKLTLALMPLCLVGVALRLFAPPRWGQAGLALAGFALIFVGLGTLQQGMSHWDPGTALVSLGESRLALVLFGILFTLITQSSSAGVATTLVALHSGLIALDQGLALVVGMDIGTTATAALATIGGSAAVRRTGFSHVIFNLFTGIGALLLISPYLQLCNQLSLLGGDPELLLVAFHSMFNLMGVLLVLPLTPAFSRLMMRLVPDPSDASAMVLEPAWLEDAPRALGAVFKASQRQLAGLSRHLSALLGGKGQRQNLQALKLQMLQSRDYLDHLHLPPSANKTWTVLLALIAVQDHLYRLLERCEEEEERALTARSSISLKREARLLLEQVEPLLPALSDTDTNLSLASLAGAMQKLAQHLQQSASAARLEVMGRIGQGELDLPSGTQRLEAIRWLERVSAHLAKVLHLLEQAQQHLGEAARPV